MIPVTVVRVKNIRDVMESKKHVLKFRAVNRDIFEGIKSSKKKVYFSYLGYKEKIKKFGLITFKIN